MVTAEYPNYDGRSADRPVHTDRPPSALDWEQIVAEVLAIQDELAIVRAIPTSDQEDSETIWNDGGVFKVSGAG